MRHAPRFFMIFSEIMTFDQLSVVDGVQGFIPSQTHQFLLILFLPMTNFVNFLLDNNKNKNKF